MNEEKTIIDIDAPLEDETTPEQPTEEIVSEDIVEETTDKQTNEIIQEDKALSQDAVDVLDNEEMDSIIEYIWDDEQYKNFIDVYLFDVQKQLSGKSKWQTLIMLSSFVLIVACISLMVSQLMQGGKGSVMLYVAGIVVGLLGINFARTYKVKVLERIQRNLKVFMLTNDFKLTFGNDTIVTPTETVDLTIFSNVIVYKDVLFLISPEKNNFMMINIKDNPKKEELLQFLKSKDYLQFTEESELFSLSKYGIIQQKK